MAKFLMGTINLGKTCWRYKLDDGSRIFNKKLDLGESRTGSSKSQALFHQQDKGSHWASEQKKDTVGKARRPLYSKYSIIKIWIIKAVCQDVP